MGKQEKILFLTKENPKRKLNFVDNTVKKKAIIASQDMRLQKALEFLFTTEPRVFVAGLSESVAGLLALTQITMPDLVLLDWDLNEQSSSNLLNDLRQINPSVKTIVFSNSLTGLKSRFAGKDVWITKGTQPDAILKNFNRLFEITTPH